MPNALLYHDWYFSQNGKPNIWSFGVQAVTNRNRLASSGEVPCCARNRGLNLILPDNDIQTFGVGLRWGRLMAATGWLKQTYLRAELTTIIPRSNAYPGDLLFQIGLGLYKVLPIN